LVDIDDEALGAARAGFLRGPRPAWLRFMLDEELIER
jgi:hypothetical protein